MKYLYIYHYLLYMDVHHLIIIIIIIIIIINIIIIIIIIIIHGTTVNTRIPFTGFRAYLCLVHVFVSVPRILSPALFIGVWMQCY